MSTLFKKLLTRLQYYYHRLLRRTLQGSVRYSANATTQNIPCYSSKGKVRSLNEFQSSNPLRLCVQSFVFLAAIMLLCFNTSNAQPNSDNQYAKPLKEVLNNIQKNIPLPSSTMKKW